LNSINNAALYQGNSWVILFIQLVLHI